MQSKWEHTHVTQGTHGALSQEAWKHLPAEKTPPYHCESLILLNAEHLGHSSALAL